MTALVTGATGTLGGRLLRQLGDDVVVTSRNPEKARQTIKQGRVVGWDGESKLPDEALEGVDVIYHLAGDPIADGRWTEEKKARIRQSRVRSTRGIVEAIRRATSRPRTFVCGTAVGIYGSRGDEVLTEESGVGTGFLASVCEDWESEARPAEALGLRVVRVRTGVVLATEGGALPTMLPLFKAGVAGKLGDGKQWMPWIHLDDIVGLLRFAGRDERVSGPLNGAAPEPVTNRTFTRALGDVLHRPTLFAAPAFALRLALGDKACIVLDSMRAVPRKALELGFEFAHPSLDGALHDLLDAPAKAGS